MLHDALMVMGFFVLRLGLPLAMTVIVSQVLLRLDARLRRA